MTRLLIVGYGNPLRGDDGLGWHAAQILADILNDEAHILKLHQLMPELAELVSRTEFAIFIDAAVEGVPGQIISRAVVPGYRASSQPFTHQFDLPTLLACAQSLYGHCPQAVLFTITGESFGLTEEISATVSKALPLLVEQVRGLTQRLSEL
jgi:hydrogenase maturation protease